MQWKLTLSYFVSNELSVIHTSCVIGWVVAKYLWWFQTDCGGIAVYSGELTLFTDDPKVQY